MNLTKENVKEAFQRLVDNDYEETDGDLYLANCDISMIDQLIEDHFKDSTPEFSEVDEALSQCWMLFDKYVPEPNSRACLFTLERWAKIKKETMRDKTVKKIHLMCHALGVKVRNFKKNEKQYICYRNGFYANKPDQLWEELVDVGLAESNESDQGKIIYSVSDEGLKFLGKIYEKCFVVE